MKLLLIGHITHALALGGLLVCGILLAVIKDDTNAIALFSALLILSLNLGLSFVLNIYEGGAKLKRHPSLTNLEAMEAKQWKNKAVQAKDESTDDVNDSKEVSDTKSVQSLNEQEDFDEKKAPDLVVLQPSVSNETLTFPRQDIGEELAIKPNKVPRFTYGLMPKDVPKTEKPECATRELLPLTKDDASLALEEMKRFKTEDLFPKLTAKSRPRKRRFVQDESVLIYQDDFCLQLRGKDRGKLEKAKAKTIQNLLKR